MNRGLTVLHVAELSSLSTLFGDVSQQITDLGIPQGIEESLLAKLDAVHNALQKGNDQAAANQINALLHHIAAQSGKRLNEEEADSLSELLEEALALL